MGWGLRHAGWLALVLTYTPPTPTPGVRCAGVAQERKLFMDLVRTEIERLEDVAGVDSPALQARARQHALPATL